MTNVETVTDITREMIGDACDPNAYPENYMWRRAMSEYARRIETAFDRHRKDIVQECDNWRKQALEENAALDVARETIASLEAENRPVLYSHGTKEETLAKLSESLEEARRYAFLAGLDHHFCSEVHHLLSTVEANREK